MSQNVERLAIGDSAPSFLLHPQGKVAAWGRISRVDEEEFWFDVDEGFGPASAERLQRFLLRTKSTIEAFTWPMVSLRGPGAERPASVAATTRVLVASIGENQVGFDLLGPDAGVPSGIEVGDPAGFEAQRITLRWPVMGADIFESTIPAELGIVNESTDFTKGCYVGQELVARIDSRGSNTPRKMHRVSGGGAMPATGSDLTVSGDAIGVLTSVAATSNGGWVALASIKRAAETPCEAQVDGAVAQVEAAS